MLDDVFLSVSDLQRSIDFYTAALRPLGIVNRLDYDGSQGPPGHPNLKGFGAGGACFLAALRHPSSWSAHVGIVANNRREIDMASAAAIRAGALDH